LPSTSQSPNKFTIFRERMVLNKHLLSTATITLDFNYPQKNHSCPRMDCIQKLAFYNTNNPGFHIPPTNSQLSQERMVFQNYTSVDSKLKGEALTGSPVLGHLAWFACPGSPVLICLSWVTCPGSPVLGYPSWVTCPGSPVLGYLWSSLRSQWRSLRSQWRSLWLSKPNVSSTLNTKSRRLGKEDN
jgi:hypothetical protein